MKLQSAIIVCMIFTIPFAAQKKEILTHKEKQTVERFNREYKKKNYKKFEGKITFRESLILFDNKSVFYDKSDLLTASVLKNGLIYPQLLTDYQMEKFINETTDKTQKRFLKLQKDPRAAFDVNNIDMKISELTFLNTNEKARRFKITTKSTSLPNPLTYTIELTNSKAVKNMSFEDFVKDAKLTYLDQE